MLLPIGDTPNPRETPYANFLLIGLNVAVFLLISLPLMYQRPDLNDPLLLDYLHTLGVRGAVSARDILQHVTAYDLFVYRYGFRPAEGSILTLFTAMFLHGGWLHIAGNMLFLWIFGDNVEKRLGHVGYLFLYLLSGVAATLFFAMFVPHSSVPLVGASGAISGVLGCYFLWFPRNKVKVFIFLFPFIITTVLIPARLVLGFFLIIDNVLPFLLTKGSGGGVAHGAHIGGFLTGLAIAFGVEYLSHQKGWSVSSFQERRRQESSSPPPPEQPLLNPAEQFAHFLRHERPDRAATLFLSLKNPDLRNRIPADDLVAVGEQLLGQGKVDLALTLLRRYISDRPNSVLLDRAYLAAGRAMLQRPRCETSAYQYFLSALDVTTSPSLAVEARKYLRVIEGQNHSDANAD